MEYNYSELAKYYNTRNYQGGIDYLNQFNFEGQNAIIARNEINNLKRAKAIEDSMSKKLMGEDKEAYNFMQGIASGYIDRDRDGSKNNKDRYSDGTPIKTTNKYGNEYLNYMNNLKAEDGSSVSHISVLVDDKDALTRIQKELNLDKFQGNDLGIKLAAASDGKYRLIMDKSNTNIYKLMNAVKNLQNADENLAVGALSTAFGALGGAIGSFGSFGIGTVPATMLGVATGALIGEGVDAIFNDYHIEGVANGKYQKIDTKSLVKAVDIVNDAEKRYNNIQNTYINNTDTLAELSVSGYMSAGHAEAGKRLAERRLSIDDYNKVTKMWEDYLPNLISHASFANKPVYVFGDKDDSTKNGKLEQGIMLEQVKNTEAEDVKTEILNAFDEKRVTYAMATMDGQIGTMFTIKPDEDTKNNISDKFGNRRMHIFVQGLYEGPAEEYYEKDTKTKAVRTNADMRKYNYGLELSNGETVGYEDGIPYKQLYNRQTKQLERIHISEEEAISSLNESAVIDQTVDYITKNFNSTTGKVDTEGQYDEIQSYSIDELLRSLSKDTIDNLYPKGQYNNKERSIKKALIYQYFYKNLPDYIKSYA